MELYPHNLKAYNNIIKSWDTENKTCIVHATGTGKSYIIIKIINDNPKARILLVAPNNFILNSIRKQISHKSFVKCVTYQYLALDKNSSFAYEQFQFIILDEYHRAGATFWEKPIRNIIENNPNAKLLGTTATNVRYLDSNRDMTELFNNNIVSHISLAEAIKLKIHKKPIYITSVFDISNILEELKTKLIKSNLNNLDDKLHQINSSQISWEESIGVDRIIRKYLTPKRRKIIVFCKKISELNSIHKLLAPIFDSIYVNEKVNIQPIHSRLGMSKVNEIFKKFSQSSEPQVLLSVDLLNEGIHVPNTDTIMMFRDTISPIIYLQQLGRCFHSGQIINPMIFDFVNNLKLKNSEASFVNDYLINQNEPETENSNILFDRYKNIIEFKDETVDFQNFLSDFDTVKTWEMSFNELKSFLAENNRMPTNREFKWTQYQKQLFNENKLSDDKISKLLSLDSEFFSRKVLTWEENYSNLMQFIETNERFPTNAEFAWIISQKIAYQNNKLSAIKIKKLEALNPKFFEVRSFKTWEESYNEIKEYIEVHKKLPTKLTNFEWLIVQRTHYRNNELSQDKIDLLLKLHENIFEFKRLKTDEYMQILKDKLKELGRVPTRQEFSWIHSQKEKFYKKTLNDSLKEEIEKLIPDFFRVTKTWDERFLEVIEFYKINNRLPLNSESQWGNTQKINYNKGKLSEERYNKIISHFPNFFDNIGIVIKDYDEELLSLKEFVQKNKRLPLNKENRWLVRQKTLFSKNKLEQSKIDDFLKIHPLIFEKKIKAK